MRSIKEKLTIFKGMLLLCEEALNEVWDGEDDDWWGEVE